jgi:hypothetical protein
MPPANHSSAHDQPPEWALEQASEELYEESKPEVVADRARDTLLARCRRETMNGTTSSMIPTKVEKPDRSRYSLHRLGIRCWVTPACSSVPSREGEGE